MARGGDGIKNALSSLEEERAALKDRLARVEKAILALSAITPVAPNNRQARGPKKRKTSATPKKALPVDQYERRIRALLKKQGKNGLTWDELTEAVREDLGARGESRVGLRIRVSQATQSLGLVEEDGVLKTPRRPRKKKTK